MLGREAYHNPYILSSFDARYYGDHSRPKTREEVVLAMLPYISQQLAKYGDGGRGLKLNSITRHMLGLTFGLIGARAFRQTLSDTKKLAAGNPSLLLEALLKVKDANQGALI
jgi:tRNA-dihydrouridine synthase A